MVAVIVIMQSFYIQIHLLLNIALNNIKVKHSLNWD